MTSSPAGNLYKKYDSKNPIYKLLVNRFVNCIENATLSLGNIGKVLDAGCGEGYITNKIAKLNRIPHIEGVDVSYDIIQEAKKYYPFLKFSTGSIYNLAFKENEFDLVLACEVLEHLENYEKAILEIKRVSNRYCIISVPVEPLWRILNVARGAYMLSLGNTPGHLQHWTRKNFKELLSKHFTIEKILSPLPWQVAICRK